MATPETTKPKTAPRQWAGAVGVVLIVGVLLIMPVHYPGRWLGVLFDFAHLPVFAVLVYCVTRFVAGSDPSWKVAGGIAFVAALFGLSAEIVQGMVGRSASMGDAVSNAVGSLAGLVFVTRKKWRRGPFVVACILLAVAWILAYLYPISIGRDILRQKKAFPLLASFEDDLELSRWIVRRGSIRRSDLFSSDGNHCLEWRLRPGRFPRCTLRWPPADWTNHGYLELDVWNDGDQDIAIHLKIHDYKHNNHPDDRFEQQTLLKPGKTTIKVNLGDVRSAPKDREMDMAAIGRVQLFTVDLEEPRTLYLDNVRLSNTLSE